MLEACLGLALSCCKAAQSDVGRSVDTGSAWSNVRLFTAGILADGGIITIAAVNRAPESCGIAVCQSRSAMSLRLADCWSIEEQDSTSTKRFPAQCLFNSAAQPGLFKHSSTFRSRISSGNGPQRRIAS